MLWCRTAQMVKFGRHLHFFADFEQPVTPGNTAYLVPYDDMRKTISDGPGAFAAAWRTSAPNTRARTRDRACMRVYIARHVRRGVARCEPAMPRAPPRTH